MHVDLDNLAPGSVTDEVFDLIVKGAGFHSVQVIEALRDHLVFGHERVEAYEQRGVQASSFSSRMKLFQGEVDRLRKIIKLCTPQPEARIQALSEIESLALQLSEKSATLKAAMAVQQH